jgi:hypothetical protein
MGSIARFRLGWLLLAAGLGSLPARDAQAAGRVLRSDSGSAAVVEVRVAHAASSAWSRLWTQYRLNGSGRTAIVTPVAPATFVDPTTDAWFEALEEATAPRIVPPLGASLCGPTQATSVDVTGNLSHDQTIAPAQVAVLSDLAQVLAFAASQKLVVSSADQTALEQEPGPFVALVYQLAGTGALTQPVRYSTRGSAAALPLPLVVSASEPDITLFTIGAGRARIAGAPEHTPDALGFGWSMMEGKSDYVALRRQLLAQENGKSWLVETTGTAPLYQWSVLPNQAGSVPPVVQIYFERALAQGAATGSAQKCLEPVWDAQELGESGAIVSDPCPGGALAIVPASDGSAPGCDPAPSAGQIAAASLACGMADDLAHALAGTRPDLARITRSRSVAGSDSGAASIELHDGMTLPRVLTAPSADLNGCLPGDGAGGSGGGSGGGTGASGTPGEPGYGGSDGAHAHTDVSVSCAGSSETSSSNDSCSGDSSSGAGDDSCSGDSSSGASNDSCSGDSSSGAGDDSCSGDSSSSSDSTDSCTGDSSSSASDGSDACSGDSSDGYGSTGDGCSGDSGSGADSGCSGGDSASGADCNVSRLRSRRPKLSLWLLISAAIALPLRRRRRDLAAGRERTH